MTPNILILDRHAADYATGLRALFPGLNIVPAAAIGEFRGGLASVDVLIAFGLSVSDAILGEAKALKWIQALGTGVDYFQRSSNLRPDIVLTSARGIHGPAMRENVIFLMQSLSRDTAGIVRRQKECEWQRVAWPLLHGKTAVILGTGISGTAIAQGLKALGMIAIGVTRSPRTIDGFERTVPIESLAQVAAQADYLINVMPGEAANRNLIGADVFRAMKSSGYFINVGRGDSVDEAALIGALNNGNIAGAALDVFRAEPLPSDDPLWRAPNIFLTPHIGGFFAEYPDHVIPLIAENLRCFIDGRVSDMKNVVVSNL